MRTSLFRSRKRATWLVATAIALSGCAAGPNPRDPMEPFNRQVSEFNEGVDALVLKPAATVYKKATPALVRTGVSNFFSNIRDLWSFVNSALQFKLQDATESLARFHVNTMFGLGGIIDVASELNIERHKEDFGQTLGRWGVPPGPYVVLPFLGPSTLRDTAALPVDYRGDLLRQLHPSADRDLLYGVRAIDARANLLRIGGVIDEAALDKYSFTRDAYLQKRQAEIFEHKQDDKEGAEPQDGEIPPLPDDGPTKPKPKPAPAGQPQPVPAR
jgi:phospholipid-binding lipoprotein MlaA